MTPEEAKQRLKNYQPMILIMGIRRSGELESVLILDKKTYFEEAAKFSEYRTFYLKEEFKNIQP